MPTLSLFENAGGRSVRIRRGKDVDDDLWLSVRAIFGSRGPDVGQEVQIPLESFLGRFRWLVNWRGDIEWPPQLKEKAERALRQSKLLEAAVELSVPEESSEPESNPGRFTRELKPFQIRDLAKLRRLPHGANFSVTGGGKTAVTLACYEAERTRGRVGQLLLVAPYSAFESWEVEVGRCFEQGRPDVRRYEQGRPIGHAEILLVAYQRLASAYDELAAWLSQRPTMLVLDEAHRAKRGKAGVWGRACLDLGFLAERRDILSGTPAPNSLDDLRSLFEFLWHSEGARLVAEPDLEHGDTATVSERIRLLFTRTTKAELDLPTLTTRVVSVPMGGLQSAIYAALVGRLSVELEGPRRDSLYFRRLGRVVMYLLQAATNPALLTQGGDRYDPIDFRIPPLPLPADSELRLLLSRYSQHEPPQKFIHLADLVRKNAELGRKTLVWSHFVRNLTSLRRLLADFQPAMIHGGTKLSGPESRDEELTRFRHDPDCLLLLANPQTLGEGISLHEHCHDAVFIDRTFNAGLYLQSIDRIHRLGLAPDDQTTVTLLITQESVDEVVEARLVEKMGALSQMLADPGLRQLAMPDEEESAPLIDTLEDVSALLSHFAGVRDRLSAGA